MKKIRIGIIVFAALTVWLVADFLANYAVRTTLAPTDRIPFSQDNGGPTQGWPSRNIPYTNLVLQLQDHLDFGGAGVSDGDKGDIVVSGSGLVWEIDEAAAEGKLDLQDLQGAVVDGQIPAAITRDAEWDTEAEVETVWGSGIVNTTETTAIAANARVAVNKNSGATTGTRRRINFIEGANTTITVADDAGNEEVDVTIATTGGGTGDPVLFSGSAVGDANGVDLTNVVQSATVMGVTWTHNTGTTPDLATPAFSAASSSGAGFLTSQDQSLGGIKTFTSGLAASNSPAYFSGPIWNDWETVSGTEVDAATGNSFTKTLSANLTFTVVNAVDGMRFRFRFVQNATGGFTVTAPSHVPRNGTNQTAVTSLQVNTNANAITVFYFERISGTWEVSGPDGMSSIPLTKFDTASMTSAEFGAQITDDVGTNGVMRTRVGVVRSFAVPMGAWFTNGLASTATPASYTNTADSFGFADGVTNTIRVRFPMPLGWDGNQVKFQFSSGTTLTNETSATNVVWSIKAATIQKGGNDDEANQTWGTAVTVTNHVHKSPYVSATFITPLFTPGNTPSENSDVIWQVTRLTTDATDVNTNTVHLLSAQVFYTESATEPSMPATTN